MILIDRFDVPGPLSAQRLLEAMEGVAYIVNKDGAIVAIGCANWDAFASENGAARLNATSILGRDLYDFICGDDVKQSYRLFTRTIFEQKENTISFTYRCDAPEVQREMRMCISPIKTDGEVISVLFHSLVVQEQDRPRINLFDPDKIVAMTKIPPDAIITTVCSYCHNVLFDNGHKAPLKRWVKPEEYYRAGGSSEVWVSHGMCPPCHERLVAPLLKEERG